ncbi:methyltransferase domain-containing protein [Lewinella sp. W8]|uniref:methyltransferase domain-containing protein n=1 Tax=Lewinella sp. W8 TaxID=2528208 RepID=UPI001067B49D|nr:methyltransferase domain-containing protein [Lewinella sp. W8]MTB53751.1 methyltransferase domain-containing protein [Lewinella sp. W8]
MEKHTAAYWSSRYRAAETGWDIGYVSTPIKEYLDQLEDKSLKILIPGAGRGYEAEYAWRQGFTNVHVLDLAKEPLEDIQRRVPDFPAAQLHQGDFFAHRGSYDLILEQTFFCALPPSQRPDYAAATYDLLAPNGKLVGLWFTFPLRPGQDAPPYGGDRKEYLGYLASFFRVRVFEEAYNSIPPRAGNELFGIFEKREEVAPAPDE